MSLSKTFMPVTVEFFIFSYSKVQLCNTGMVKVFVDSFAAPEFQYVRLEIVLEKPRYRHLATNNASLQNIETSYEVFFRVIRLL